jgi:hypothetical protein
VQNRLEDKRGSRKEKGKRSKEGREREGEKKEGNDWTPFVQGILDPFCIRRGARWLVLQGERGARRKEGREGGGGGLKKNNTEVSRKRVARMGAFPFPFLFLLLFFNALMSPSFHLQLHFFPSLLLLPTCPPPS